MNSATHSAWTTANKNTNAAIDKIAQTVYIPPKRLEEYKQDNMNELPKFQVRRTNGLNLSDRVWNLTGQLRQEIEIALDIGIGEGKSAAELAREMKKYLKEPDRLYRKVRDKHGDLQWSKAAKAYRPGQGVYRSSYKNALRMVRTEINMAYNMADYLKWQQLYFVIGIEISLSNNHPIVDICDELMGKYPKDFLFLGWHPQCRCKAVPIMMSVEEMKKIEKMTDEERANYKSPNEIKDVPDSFKKWVAENADRIEKANKRGTLPYFLKALNPQSKILD